MIGLQALSEAKSVQSILKAHRQFLSAAAEVCMAGEQSSWSMIYSAQRKLLDMAFQLHALGKLHQASFLLSLFPMTEQIAKIPASDYCLPASL